MKRMEWIIDDYEVEGKQKISINGIVYLVSDDTACLSQLLSCIVDSLDSLNENLNAINTGILMIENQL